MGEVILTRPTAHTGHFTTREKKRWCPLNRRGCGFNSRSGRFGEETNLVRSGIRTPDCPVPSTVTIPTKQSDSI